MPEPIDPDAEARRIRALLRAARHDEPIPDDVANRLDDVLADLSRERSTSVTPIRKKRRWAPAVVGVGAAAAVSAVVVPQLVGGGSMVASGGSSSTADSAGGSAMKSITPEVAGGPVQLRSKDLQAQVQAYASSRSAATASNRSLPAAAQRACGRLVLPATLDGKPAWITDPSRPRGATRVVVLTKDCAVVARVPVDR